MEDMRTLIIIANTIRQAICRLRNESYLELLNQLASLVKQFKELGVETRKLGTSVARGWLFAADRCRTRTRRVLGELPYTASRIIQFLDRPGIDVPALSLLVGELRQIREEFARTDFDKEENCLSVETESVQLEDLYLGPFEIRLDLNKLGELCRSTPYRVVALDPNPPATDDSVTHPHVSNDTLCEGDASAAIRSALEQGRLCDFFTLVRSVLNTYNPDSPYVSLDDWYGEPCYSCGYVMSRDNTYFCSFCEHDYCEQCSTYCRVCDETICDGCAVQCELCEQLVCSGCASRCAECGMIACGSCLEDGLCPDCKQEELENENQQEQSGRQPENRGQTNGTKAEVECGDGGQIPRQAGQASAAV